jgi:hypothetical protein
LTGDQPIDYTDQDKKRAYEDEFNKKMADYDTQLKQYQSAFDK